MTLADNKAKVFSEVQEACLEAGRNQESVSIIAVTKYVDSHIAGQLIDTGISHIGENRVDKFLDKYEALKDKENLTWHLIGTLQRRKVKDVINYVDYFHALDSVKLAQEIDKRADHTIKCFLQVNISEEESKHGFKLEEIDQVLTELENLSSIELVGLMTMAPIDATEEELEEIFEKTDELRIRLQEKQIKNMPMTELSMGMSGDFKLAIKHNASFVRIGTAFFK
ncbi:YggS family pyridoxal phosphate-dependent enzyme [Streptococcus loxodontisalivarius]|uniref:Pyridoxal phosphate homeostasis protein n=1 Tax=Streptococcus loxodontisalivarius TaxID=1349415 RepID=A0ABS2PRE4_9STRE|nr:YggS family pyridoxal phosphate-dependent enzyme [Streptococcus loxodontisalivarius]MBM7642616.1 pyridoxal phosphate enzyme (YggS family) [Streptococcus loxodontisalivarius]